MPLQSVHLSAPFFHLVPHASHSRRSDCADLGVGLGADDLDDLGLDGFTDLVDSRDAGDVFDRDFPLESESDASLDVLLGFRRFRGVGGKLLSGDVAMDPVENVRDLGLLDLKGSDPREVPWMRDVTVAEFRRGRIGPEGPDAENIFFVG